MVVGGREGGREVNGILQTEESAKERESVCVMCCWGWCLWAGFIFVLVAFLSFLCYFFVNSFSMTEMPLVFLFLCFDLSNLCRYYGCIPS